MTRPYICCGCGTRACNGECYWQDSPPEPETCRLCSTILEDCECPKCDREAPEQLVEVERLKPRDGNHRVAA